METKPINLYLIKKYDELLEIADNIIRTSSSKEDYRDICNEMVMSLLELPIEKQELLIQNDQIIPYFIKMVQHSAFSQNSSYQRKYNMIEYRELPDWIFTELPDDIDKEEFCKFELLKEIIDTLTWDERKLYDLKVTQNLTFSEIQELTTIPRTSSWVLFQNIKKKIYVMYKRRIDDLSKKD